ncbi:MAG TPA: hypothetical protein VHO03_14090 [Ignavibacteriales bacterium]|nr:hypothetical protein [Ignavibacteriales bacterium]
MKENQDYIRDIAEIRSMMERSSKFLSLSGWAGIMAGIYALAGAYIAYSIFNFNLYESGYNSVETGTLPSGIPNLIFLAVLVLVLAIGTAVFLSVKKAKRRGEVVWNAASRRLLADMAVPLTSGGILILVLISKGLIGLIPSLTLLFYGLALYNASKITYNEVKFLGMIQVALGLISSFFTEYGLLFWAFGFGVLHIIYGIYIHFRYER